MTIPSGATLAGEAQADSDAHLVALWLHGKAASTQEAYEGDIARFLAFVDKPLREVRLGDVQAFVDSLKAPSDYTKARRVASVKSLLSFGHKLGYVQFDVGRPIKTPKAKNTLAERIMSEADTHRVIALEPGTRNRVMLRLLYASGVRVSELCGLKWRDLQERGEAGQVTVFGKGGKTRTILLSVATWQELMSLRNGGQDEPVFPSCKLGGHLDPSQVLRIVQAAARRASVVGNVSPTGFVTRTPVMHSIGAHLSILLATRSGIAVWRP